MKSSILYSVALALLSATAVLAQSENRVSENGVDRSSASGAFRGSSSDAMVERPSEQSSQELSSQNANGAEAASSPTSEPEVEESSDSTPFYITAPPSGKTYTKGSTVSIEWINGIDELFKIKVLAGSDPKSMHPANVPSFKAQGNKGEYKWTIPNNLSDGIYAFNFIFANQVGGKTVTQESYSEQFKIVSPGGSSA